MRFKALTVAFVTISLAAGASAQTPAATPQFSPDSFRAHVAYLADDRLEGRESGSPGYEIAARYVADRFEALGLSPGASGNWFQPIEFVRYEIDGTPRLTVGERVFAHGQEFVLRASPDPEPLRIDAPLVFAGFGLDLPARGFDDYRGLDVRGKIVVVLNGTPKGTPSDVAAHMNAEKARMAAERGAVGLIILRAGSEGAPWSRFAGTGSRPGTTWIDGSGQPVASNGLRFSATAGPDAAAALFQGAPRTLEQVLAEASQHGARPAGFDLPGTARLEREGARATRFSSPNVVAMLPGSDPEVADEYVLMMAHLDGLGVRQGGEGDRIRNGAMDNATGVATLIEAAQAMVQSGTRPRRPILFAAVTAEEVGLLGSEFLARNPVGEGRVVSVVNLDMPILTYDFQDVTAFGAEHSTLGPIVERAAARMNVRLSPDPLPEQGLFTRSDHYEFVRVGVPSVFLMTGFAGEGRQRFTDYLANQYHTPRDDLSLPFDWAAGAKFAQLNYLIAREIADEDSAPLWYADSFFGEAVGGSQLRAQRVAGDGQAAAR